MLSASAPAETPPKSVFISYSRADLDEVRPLAQALRRTGLKTWLDLDDLRPGERWKQAIGEALAGADAMVFCVSHLSLESAWTSVELRRAVELGLPVVPVAVQRVDPTVLPPPLRELQVCDMSRHPPRHAAALTAREIAAVLGWPLADAASPRHAAGRAPGLVVALQVPLWPGSALLSAIAGTGPLELLDLGHADRIRLADLGDWAQQASDVVVAVGPLAPPGLVGLVLGRLTQAFGARRVRLCWCGEGMPPDALALLAHTARVALAVPQPPQTA